VSELMIAEISLPAIVLLPLKSRLYNTDVQRTRNCLRMSWGDRMPRNVKFGTKVYKLWDFELPFSKFPTNRALQQLQFSWSPIERGCPRRPAVSCAWDHLDPGPGVTAQGSGVVSATSVAQVAV